MVPHIFAPARHSEECDEIKLQITNRKLRSILDFIYKALSLAEVVGAHINKFLLPVYLPSRERQL